MRNLVKCAVIGLIVGFLFIRQPFMLIIFSQVLIWGLAALGVNLVSGYTGQMSIGHTAFMLIGAYTAALLKINVGTPFVVNLLVAVVFCIIAGLIIGLPALRLKAFYLAIATMAFVFAVEQIAAGTHFLGGHLGIRDIPKLFKSDFWTYIANLSFFLIISFGVNVLIKSPFGIRYKMVRDSEMAAEAYGVNLAKVKLNAFVISAVICGIAGVLWAHTIGYVYPADFGLFPSVYLLAFILIGGFATIEGGFIGAVILTGIPFFFSRSQIPMNILVGVSLIVFVLFFPKGISHGLRTLYSKYVQIPLVWLIKTILKMKKPPGNIAEINGNRVHYVEHGEGKPVMMIHGNQAHHKWFSNVWDMPGFRTITVDLPNHGYSSWIERVSIEDYADIICDLMDHLKLENVIIVGHSLGGLVTQTIALKRPNKIDKIVLLASGPPDGIPEDEERSVLYKRLIVDHALARLSLGAAAPTMKKGWFLDTLTNYSHLQNPEVCAGHPREVGEFDITGESMEFDGPVLFILGKKDNIITREMADKTINYFGDRASLKIFNHFGHSMNVEDPELFKKEFTAFCTEN